jgi:hypothetical protein
MGITNIEPNSIGMLMADALRKGKSGANSIGRLPEKWPIVGGMGAGDLLFGKGPELAESMAHGFSPLRGSGTATSVDPRIVDLAMTPLPAGLMAKGASMATQKMTAKILRESAEKATDMGRREFMQNAGALAGATAMGAAVPGAVKGAAKLLGKETIAPVTAHVGESLIPKISEKLVEGYKKWFPKEGAGWLDDINYMSNSGFDETHLQKMFEEFSTNPLPHDVVKRAVGDIPHDLIKEDIIPRMIISDDAPALNEIRQKTWQAKVKLGKGEQLPEWPGLLAEEKRLEALATKGTERYTKDPEFAKQVDYFHMTGKLPKGAPEEAGLVPIHSLPRDSPVGALWNHVQDRIPVESSYLESTTPPKGWGMD